MLFLIHSKTSFSRCQTRSSQEISFTRVYYRCIHSQVISLLQVDDIWHLSNTSIDCNFNMLSTKKCPNVIDIGKLSYYSVGKLHRVCLISKRTSLLLFKYFFKSENGKKARCLCGRSIGYLMGFYGMLMGFYGILMVF